MISDEGFGQSKRRQYFYLHLNIWPNTPRYWMAENGSIFHILWNIWILIIKEIEFKIYLYRLGGLNCRRRFELCTMSAIAFLSNQMQTYSVVNREKMIFQCVQYRYIPLIKKWTPRMFSESNSWMHSLINTRVKRI